MTAPAPALSSRSELRQLSGPYGVAMAVGFAVVVASMYASWSRFPGIWSNHHEHGMVAAAFCLWLAWRDREALLSADKPATWVLLPLIGLSLLWMVSVAISVQVVHLALAPVILLLWLWAVRGQKPMTVALPIVMTFMLAVPVWEVLTTPLQNLTVLVNELALAVSGIKADITGTSIHLASGTIIVAESCSGLNYLQSGLTLGAIYALAFTRNWRTQIKIVLVAACLALISNWIRVFGLVVIGHVTEMRAHLLREHGVYGWTIFALTIPVFALIARKIEDRDAKLQSAPLTRNEPAAAEQQTQSPLRPAAASIVAITGPLLLLLLTAAYSPAPSPEPLPGLTPSHNWVAVASQDSSWTPSLSGFTSHKRQSYQYDSTIVQVDRYVFASRAQEAEMIGYGNRIAADSLVINSRMVGPLDSNLRMVRETIIASHDLPRVTWSWYRAGGIETSSGRKAELLEFWGLLTDSPPSETIVVSTTCEPDNCKQAVAALYEVVTGKILPAGQSGATK